MKSRYANFEKKGRRMKYECHSFCSYGTSWILAQGPTVDDTERRDSNENLKRRRQLKFIGQNNTKKELMKTEFQKEFTQKNPVIASFCRQLIDEETLIESTLIMNLEKK